MITLYVQRHGQATHNAAEDHAQHFEISKGPIHTGQEFFDAPLTVKGFEQAKGVRKPAELLEPDTSLFEFWVSPLRRALQTAVVSLPSVKRWRVVEVIREIAGEKLCDSRHTKQEIELWVSRNCPGVEQWLFDDLQSDDDLYRDRPREEAGDVLRRVASALTLMLHSDKKKFVWVSHSAFLSCLFAVLDRLPLTDRWLDNGAWQKLELSREDVRDRIAAKLRATPQAFLRLKNDQVGNALNPVELPALPDGVYLYTTEMLASLAFATQASVRVVTVLAYPLGSRDASAAAACIAERLSPAASEGTDLTPPTIVDGSGHVFVANDKSHLKVARLGIYATSSVLLVCTPREATEKGCDDLPGYVSAEYLRNVLIVARAIKTSFHAPAVAVVFPYDM